MANHKQLQTLTCLGASELHPKGHRSGSHQPQPASALSSPFGNLQWLVQASSVEA